MNEPTSKVKKILSDMAKLDPDERRSLYSAAINPPKPEPEQWDIEVKPRYDIRTAADALKPQPPVEYVVDRLITAGSVCVFYGEPGAKKTYAMVSLIVAVAGGLPWLDFKTKQCPVLFVDEESGEVRLSRRLGEALRGERCGSDLPLFYVCLAGLKLDDKLEALELENMITTTGAKLVILDALADIMAGDENSKQDTQPIFTALRKIADRTGAAIVIIHHSNKLGGYRGSSAIKGAVDLMVKVDSEDGKEIINFTSEKNRDGERQKWAALATWLEGDPEGTFTLRKLEATNEQHFNNSQTFVMNYLRDNGAQTLSDIMNSADMCSPAAAKLAVYSLVKLNEVYRTNPGAQGSEAKYAIKTS